MHELQSKPLRFVADSIQQLAELRSSVESFLSTTTLCNRPVTEIADKIETMSDPEEVKTEILNGREDVDTTHLESNLPPLVGLLEKMRDINARLRDLDALFLEHYI